MRKHLVLLLFYFAISNCNRLLAQDYTEYFRAIAKAETQILDSNYNDAVETYQRIFSKFNFIFPKDAYIAAQIAAYSNQDESCLQFLIDGFKNGLPLENAVHNPHLLKWSSKPIAQILTAEFIDSLAQYDNNRYDKSYRDTIIAMVKEDQRLRNKNETFLNAVIFDHKLKPRLYKKWMQQAENQSKLILELTKQKGFPSHKTIGTQRVIDYDEFGTSYKSQYATIILFHYDFAYQILESELPLQLKLGNITPKQYALLRDFATRHLLFGEVKDTQYQDYKYFVRWIENDKKVNKEYIENRRKWIEVNLEQINKNRSEIGLIPYEYQEKMKSVQAKYVKNFEVLKTENLPYFDFNYWGWE